MAAFERRDADTLQENAAQFAPVASKFIAACIDRSVPRDTLVLLPPGRLGYREQREKLSLLGYGWHVDVDPNSPRGWFFVDNGTVQHASSYPLTETKQEVYARWLRERPSRAFVTGLIRAVPKDVPEHKFVDVAYVREALASFLRHHADATGRNFSSPGL